MTEIEMLRSRLRTQRVLIKHYRGQCKRLEQQTRPTVYRDWWLASEEEKDGLVKQLAEKDKHLKQIMGMYFGIRSEQL